MKTILILRTAPLDLNMKGYNSQEMGMAKAFCDLGYNVDIVLFKSKNQTDGILYSSADNRVYYKEIPRLRFFRWCYNKEILKKEWLNNYDLVVCFEYMSIMTYLVCRICNKVVVYSGPYYNLFTFKFIHPIYNAFAAPLINKKSLGHYTKSELAKDYLSKCGYNISDVVGVGINIDDFNKTVLPTKETEVITDFMKTNECILYVGALSDRKNFPFLLEVYRLILEQRPNVKFVIIGKSQISRIKKLMGFQNDNGYEKKYLKKMPQKVQDGILRVQSVDNSQLRFIYPLAKAFLLPSKKEIFGMVLLESMYLGAPVVTSKNGGSVTLIKNKETGVIIPEFDSYKWCKEVISLIDNNEIRDTMASNANALIKERYQWRSIVTRIVSQSI